MRGSCGLDVLLVVVAVQLVVAGFEGRVIGRGETYRVVVLVPLYNEDPDVAVRMLSALLHGRTVQQPSAFAFAWMPDRWSHHYRQQERWFRGSFIRGLWRIRFLPVLSWGWWRQATGWMQIWLVISVFVYLLLWRPLVLGSGVPPTVVLVPLAVGLAQRLRYISVWRSDTSGPRDAPASSCPRWRRCGPHRSCVPCVCGGWSPAPRWGGTPASRSRSPRSE